MSLAGTVQAAANAHVSVTAMPDVISPGETSSIQIVVTRVNIVSDTRGSTNSYPLPEASITLSTTSPGISFSPATGTTDIDGKFTSMLIADSSASGGVPVYAVAQIPKDFYGEGTVTVTVTIPTVTETPHPAVNQPPVAVISVDTYAGEAPLTIRFDGQQSSDLDGAVNQYEWNFGDGKSESGYVVWHTFENAGLYTASLTVTDTQELKSNEARVSISVTAGSKKIEIITQPLTPETMKIALPLQILQSSGSRTDPQFDLNHDNNINSEDARLALKNLLVNREGQKHSCEYTAAAAANYTQEQWDKYCNWEPVPAMQNIAEFFNTAQVQKTIDTAWTAKSTVDLVALQKNYAAGILKPTPIYVADISKINGMNKVWVAMTPEQIAAAASAYGKTVPEITRVRDMSSLPKDTMPSTYPGKKLALANQNLANLNSIPDPSGRSFFPSASNDKEEDPSLTKLRQIGLDYWKIPTDFQQDYIIEGTFAMIEGRDFGTCPQSNNLNDFDLIVGDNIYCTVRLKSWPAEILSYDKADKESMAKQVQLLPATGDWKTSWNNYGIGVYIPYDKDLDSYHSTSIVIERKKITCTHPPPDAVCSSDEEILSTAERPVYLVKDMPGFNYIQSGKRSDPGDGWVVTGAEVLIAGTNFGDKPGKIWISFDAPITAYEFPKPYNKLDPSSLLPRDGKTVEITDIKWTDKIITFKTGEIKANFAAQGVKIYVQKDGTVTPAFTSFMIGPELKPVFFSGEKFFTVSGENSDGAVYQSAGGILLVSHDPQCAFIFGSGDAGDDHFFAEENKLPPNVEFQTVMFAHINPDDTQITLEWAAKMIKKIVDLIMGDIMDYAFFLVNALVSVFDNSVGQYEAEIHLNQYSNGLVHTNYNVSSLNSDNPDLRVSWANTCYSFSPFEDKDVVYAVGFFAWVPEGVDLGE